MITKKDQGKRGEDAAVTFLQKKGIQIIGRNFLIRGGEIDIIGIDKDTLVFYEVKTRSSAQFGSPFEAITYWKMKSLIHAAHVYKRTHPRLPDALRIDAIGVTIDGRSGEYTIELVENATE